MSCALAAANSSSDGVARVLRRCGAASRASALRGFCLGYRRVAPAAVDDGDEERRIDEKRGEVDPGAEPEPGRSSGSRGNVRIQQKRNNVSAAFLVWCRQRFCAAGHRPLPSAPPLPLAVDGAGAALPQERGAAGEQRWRA